MIRRTFIIIILLFALAHAAFAADYLLVTLLHTNDLHGNVLAPDIPELAKISTMIRQIRADMPNVLLLDAGDIVHGSYEDYLSGGRATISAMNAAGYTAATTGNHDYDFGTDVVRNVTSTAGFPMLAANVKDRTTGQAWDGILPYTIVNVSGVRVAIFGLTTLETAALNWPATLGDMRIDDPLETARSVVPELRKQADVIVALSHLGYNVDRKLAQQVSGIDFIIGGHSHILIDKWQWVGETMVAQTGSSGQYLGRIDFIVAKDDNGVRIVSVNGKNGKSWNDLERKPLGKSYPTSPVLPVPPGTPDDPAVVAAYMPYREQTNRVLNQIIGEAVETVTSRPSKSGETPSGDLVADAVRLFAGSDIALVDSATAKSNLNQGPVKLAEAFGLITGWTRQQIITVRMKGSDLQKSLAANLMKAKSLHLQLSGASLTYKVARSTSTDITNLLIGGVPLQAGKDYTVSGQAYVIQELLKLCPSAAVVSESKQTVREAIAAYFQKIKRVSAPVIGRISVK